MDFLTDEGPDDLRHKMPPPSPPSNLRRAVRLVGWNAVWLVAGLALIGLVGEAWLRLTTPFVGRHLPKHFVPNVGILVKPNAEVRWTNVLDFWTVQRTNSLGFLDRELISPERAAASCHVAMIGDSYVEAKEVAIADKFHVRLEALAARDLPHLDVTTSAFGRGGTGQINQLPYYDEYARHLHPKLLVLVAIPNDFKGNSVLWDAFDRFNPERMPYVTAARDADGTIRLRPPHPSYHSKTFRLTRRFGLSESADRTLSDALEKVRGTSFFVQWLHAKARIVFRAQLLADRVAWVELSRLPLYAPFLDEWRSSPGQVDSILARVLKRVEVGGRSSTLTKEDLPLVFRDPLDMTGFALDQFKARADRDGVALIILATHRMRTVKAGLFFDWMKAMAEARGIPVVDQYDYIVGRGNAVEDARWVHDAHWNPTGHQWAAEALLEYLKQHQDVCE